MTKTVTVLHVPDTLNYGSMMMGENFIYYLSRSSLQPIRFQVATPKPYETQRRLAAALTPYVDESSIIATDNPVWPGGKLKRALEVVSGRRARRTLPAWLLSSDLVVVLGGDDFTEYYSVRGPIVRLALLRAISAAGVPVVMLGQSIGPFRSWREPVAGLLLQAVARITARERITYRYLTERLKLTNVEQGVDLAFASLAKESEVYGLHLPAQYVCLVPSELLWRYSVEPSRDKYIEAMASVARAVLRQVPEAALVLLPHVLFPNEADDRRAARDLYARLQGEASLRSRIWLIEDELLPYHARQVLGRAIVVITGRMHAAISSFEKGCIAVSLAYSEKYHGIIGELLGLPELVIDVRQTSWSEIAERVVDTVRRVLGRREEYIRRMAEVIPSIQSQAIRSIASLQTYIS